MTDEEAEYWDDYFTKNPPKVDPSKKGGYFTQHTQPCIRRLYIKPFLVKR
jgi:hypothetical protein